MYEAVVYGNKSCLKFVDDVTACCWSWLDGWLVGWLSLVGCLFGNSFPTDCMAHYFKFSHLAIGTTAHKYTHTHITTQFDKY